MKKVGESYFITPITGCMLALLPAARAANGTWHTTVTGASWATNSNWVSNVIANGSGSSADFGTLDITADATVNLAVDGTLGHLVFGDTNTNSAASWTLASGVPGGKLTLAGAHNNTFLGEIQVNEGILRSTNGTSFKNMTGAVTVASGASFYSGQNFAGNNLTNALTLSGAGTGGDGALNLAYNAISSGAITLGANATISHDWNDATMNGNITSDDDGVAARNGTDLDNLMLRVNTGPALRAGDTFQLLSVSGSISLNNLNFDLPDLDAGLTWDFSSLAADGRLTVAVAGIAIGSPDFPALLLSRLDAVRDAGHNSVTINPGTYHLADGTSWESAFPLNDWSNFTINAVNGTTGIIDPATGDNYHCILTPQGDNTWRIDFPNRNSLPFSVNDWLVTRLPKASAQSHGIFLNNSTNCTIKSVTSQSGGFATFFENGGGGNRLIDCRIECSPVIPPEGTELPVVSCSADGVHARDAYPGNHIDKLVTTGVLLDDCIAIHGFFHEVTAVSGNTITVSSLGKLAVGDPVRIPHDTGYFAQALCAGIVDVGGGNYQLTLSQALPIPVGSRVCNPKFDGDGFQIINCQLSGTHSRAIITKGDNGLISGCKIQYADTAIKIGPEYYWNESGYCWNATIENTTVSDCRLGVDVNADGAMGNRNITVRRNTFGTMSQSHAIRLEGCDGATISGNSFGAPLAAEAIRFEYSKDITLANNLVDHDPSGMNILRGVSNVTNLQSEENGVLYSGRAYALSNSLSGLLLATPFSNAATGQAQQYTECNAAGRWVLQADGSGYTKIISSANGLALGINDSLVHGAPLILEPNREGDSQRWTLAPVGRAAVELVNKLSGLSATVNNTATMETVQQLTSGSGAGQLWTPSFNDITYVTWASDNGVSFEPTADDDQDGILNVMEYALPFGAMTMAGRTGGGVMTLDVDGLTDDFLTLSLQRRVAATDIVINVEYSTDLSIWQSDAVLVSSTPNPGSTVGEIWRSPSIRGNASGFMRVRVEPTD